MTRRTACSVTLSLLALLDTSAFAALLNTADLQPNDLVITEYLADPTGIFSATASPMSLRR